MYKSMQEEMDKLLLEYTKAKEDIIAEQLSDLLKNGLLEIVETQPVLISDLDDIGHRIVKMKSMVSLRLKRDEYIIKLEKENKELIQENVELTTRLSKLKEVLE